MSATQKELSPARAAAIFVFFTAYFTILLFTLLPFLKANFDLNPALYWFITGYFLFVPLRAGIRRHRAGPLGLN